MRDRIIVALDVERLPEAQNLVNVLDQAVFFKVGLQAFLAFGPELIAYLQEKGKKIFLDLKFKDIPNTVFGAVQAVLKYRPEFITIHLTGGGDMIEKARQAAASQPGLTVLGVTILTSLSNDDLKETGISLSTEEAVLRLCELGLKKGLNAFVCSPQEIEPIRRRFGQEPLLVTPGIRPAWSEKGDQKRVFTPQLAIEAGCNYMVIGRPITASPDPADAFARILQEITS
jgi:orotidine-5'-phosphate decarboxylase